jgi:hypothetical protein
LIYVEPRYLSGFLIVLWLALFGSIPIPRGALSLQVLRSIMVAIVVVVGFRVASTAVVNVGRALHTTNTSWQAAEQLKAMGVQPGDKVAAMVSTSKHTGRISLESELWRS